MARDMTVTVPANRPALSRAVAVAVPARNEAALIVPCLAALARSAEDAGLRAKVVIFVNNSSDTTAALALKFRAPALDVTVIDAVLPPALAHAGSARRAALDRAAALLPDGVLLTTDADSRVDPAWIAANLAEIDAGADAVAGVVTLDPAARATLPPLPGRELEWRLAGLQARLGDLLDPVPHDPWPNHLWAWGASLAVTRAAYLRIGGLPAVPLAEDRAFAAAIERHDLRLRHSHAPVVFTSARTVGRAPGGFADLLSAYATDPRAACDAALEPVADLVGRLQLRARVRRAHATGFGAAWAAIEAGTPCLVRRRVLPAMLTTEVELAERVISQLAARRADTAASAPAA